MEKTIVEGKMNKSIKSQLRQSDAKWGDKQKKTLINLNSDEDLSPGDQGHAAGGCAAV